MNKKLTRDYEWTTQNGKTIAVKDMEDTHLANLLWYVKNSSTYHNRKEHRQALIDVLFGEANFRGLPNLFLDRAPIPHKGEDGIWRIWSLKENRLIILNNQIIEIQTLLSLRNKKKRNTKTNKA